VPTSFKNFVKTAEQGRNPGCRNKRATWRKYRQKACSGLKATDAWRLSRRQCGLSGSGDVA
jgi:hypothetical protein